MIIQTPEETVKNVFSTFPENLDFSDYGLWIGTSVLVTWMIILVLSGDKKHRILHPVLLAVSGILGFSAYILYLNINENLGGYFLEGRVSDEMIFPEVETDPDAPPRDYLIYFPGSIRGKRFLGDIVKTDNCTVIPHGYNAAVRRFAAKLRPQDRLHLVGFSRGGGEALAAAQSIRRPIASLVLADPTADMLQAVEMRMGTTPKPSNVEFFKVYTVHNYDAPTDSNESIRRYLFFMVAKFIDPRYVEWLDTNDHGMHTTGYRIDESDRNAVENLRLRVIEDHKKALASGYPAAK